MLKQSLEIYVLLESQRLLVYPFENDFLSSLKQYSHQKAIKNVLSVSVTLDIALGILIPSLFRR